MHQRTQDATAYIRIFVEANLFLILTCNPKLSEISNKPFQNQKDRHDVIARVGHLKAL